MSKININGVTREMTTEEVAEYERLAAEHQPFEIQTTEQARMDEIEAALIELAAMLGGA